MGSIFDTRLFKVAMFGGVFVVGSCTWMERRIQTKYREQGFYQKPLIMLQKYKPAEDYLGRPIYGGRVNLSQMDKIKQEVVKAELTLPVTGPKGKGLLYVLASRETKDDEWIVDQLDLEIPSTKQKWKFFDRHLTTND